MVSAQPGNATFFHNQYHDDHDGTRSYEPRACPAHSGTRIHFYPTVEGALLSGGLPAELLKTRVPPSSGKSPK